MKLSTRCRYGIQAMFDLAQNAGKGPQTLREIAERQDISEEYLEQIAGVLRRAGFVTSVRGAQGGYRLARGASDITLGELIRTLEGPIFFADCIASSDACSRSGNCPSRMLWERLEKSVNEVVDGFTLQNMVDDYARAQTGRRQE